MRAQSVLPATLECLIMKTKDEQVFRQPSRSNLVIIKDFSQEASLLCL